MPLRKTRPRKQAGGFSPMRAIVYMLLGGTVVWLAISISKMNQIVGISPPGGVGGKVGPIREVARDGPGQPAVASDGSDATSSPQRLKAVKPALEIMGFMLRGLKCLPDWKDHAGETVCWNRDGTGCPPEVTPQYAHSADNGRQWTCSKENKDSYNCRIQCNGASSEVQWTAAACGGAGQAPCDPADGALPPPPRPPVVGKLDAEEQDRGATRPGGLRGAKMVDLRGLNCQRREGREVCFMEDAHEREICPPHVTSAFLTAADSQHVCQAGVKTHYCTVVCQTGNPNVGWLAHEHSWCKDNPGNCPPPPELIPASKFMLEEWDEPPHRVLPCASMKSNLPDKVADVTYGILANGAREQVTLRDTLATYEENGLLAHAAEVLIWLNQRCSELEGVIKPYEAKYSSIKVMGDGKQHGILGGINKLVEASTQTYFLLLEKDFQLIEPYQCVVEQLQSGIKILEAGDAHVVRYRSKDRAGRPNWAEKMYRGREDAVFKSGQPNLFCNHHYWVVDPDKRWPDKIWKCLEEPSTFYCSKAYYCNWTNNPSFFAKSWWKSAYVAKFKDFKRVDPFENLEAYMNWEPDAWNEQPWIVAQGDGLFKHVDRNNFAA